MKNRYLFSCLLIFTFSLKLLFSTPIVDLKFQQISLKEGLSQSAVYKILQDSIGFLWIATDDGLNKYDGTKFTVFKNDKSDPNSLMDNTIWSLYLQNNHFLWLGTNRGLSSYDIYLNRFENYPKMVGGEKMWIYQIAELDKDVLLLATNLGLYQFTKEKGYQKLSFPPKVQVSALMKLTKNSWLVGAFNGLYLYFSDTNSYRYVGLKGVNVAVMQHRVHHPDEVWLGTEGSGAILFNIKKLELEETLLKGTSPTNISSNFVRSLCYDNLQRLWIGTFVGLNILDEKSHAVQQIFHQGGVNEGEIAQNSIRSLCFDKQQGMWCGTYYGGLNYYHALKNQFEHIYQNGQNGLNDNIVSVLKEDSKGNLWIGTNENGINILNLKSGTFSHYRHVEGDPQSLPANSVKNVLEDESGDFWIAVQGGGFNRFLSKQKIFKRINISVDPISNNKVFSLEKYSKENKIFIGTLRGLFVYDKISNSSEEFKVNGKPLLREYQILSLFKDSKDGMWIGTNYGFYRYDLKSKKIDKQGGALVDLSLIYSFHEDRHHRVWIGAKDGLFCYNLKTHGLDKAFAKVNFPTYVVYGIEEDQHENLWLGTGNGLIVYNIRTQKWRVYLESDGIQSNQFSPYSHCKCSNGKMYFGGINGITAFRPEKMIDNPYQPAPIIDKLTVFNKTVYPNDETSILKQSIEQLKTIKLEPQYNVFGLEFIVLNYLAGQKNTFSYKLEGFDKDWYNTEKNEVSYSNLKPGKYVFRLKAANNNGKWCLNETQLNIEVLPYWYETIWAKILFLLLFISISIVLAKFYLGREFIAKELELERIDKDRIKEMEQAKIKFFVNLSHEFRTPLTLIISPVREMLEKGVKEPWVQKQLGLIDRNAERLLHLINQILDFRKTEIGAMPLHVKSVDLEQYAKNSFDLFQSMAKTKGFNYVFSSTLEGQNVCCDLNFLERILSNLLGNAFKYTPNGGSIELNISVKNHYTQIEVRDTGSGIPKDKFELIFNSFYQEENNAQGTGIGLSLVKNLVERHHGTINLESELGKGSTFTVLFPSELSQYSADEIEEKMDVELLDHEVIDGLFQPEPTDINFEIKPVEEGEQKRVILVVEDDEEIRNYLKDQLSLKFKVITAEDGKIAWNLLEKENEIELILSDIMMPEIDGVTLCKMVKQNINFSHLPFILLTAKNDVVHQLKGLQIGADDYIGKPFVYSILEAKISNIFKQHQRIYKRYIANPELNPQELVTNPLDEEFMNKAIGIVEKYLDNSEFSVEEFSREMCMSRSGLHLKIKAITGESASDFIRKVRLSTACKLLREGRYNVTEITTMIGMSTSYFSTSFKKYAGCMPSEYVKMINNKQSN